MNPESFFGELKRRNVIRMVGLYLVGAWLVVQVAGTVLPMFGAPEWLPRTIVVLLAIGFVPAVIFSWVFELTPEGLKREEDVAPEHSVTPQTGRRMDRTIIVVLVLALGYFAFDKFALTSRREAALVSSTAPNESKSIINAKSIAVLPFVNMSDDKANDYFSDGISEELLSLLAKIPQLQVTARTSSFAFKGKEIGDPGDRAHAACGARAGRLGAQGGQLGTDHGAVDQGRHRHAPVGADLRPQARRHLRDPGRDRGGCGEAAQGHAARRGAEGAHDRSRGLRAVPAGCPARTAEHRGGVPAVRRAVPQRLAIDPRYAPAWDGMAQQLHQRDEPRPSDR